MSLCSIKDCQFKALFKNKNKIFCAIHRPIKSTIINPIKCPHPRCKRNAEWSYLNDTLPRYCYVHKTFEMQKFLYGKCENCSNYATYGNTYFPYPIKCQEHKTDKHILMIYNTKCDFCNCSVVISSVGEKKSLCPNHMNDKEIKELLGVLFCETCIYGCCDKIPLFNYIGSKYPLFCKKHQKEDMEPINQTECSFLNCQRPACSISIDNLNTNYCLLHREKNYFRSPIKCSIPNCLKIATLYLPGEIKPSFCIKHRTTDSNIRLCEHRKIKCQFSNCSSEILEYGYETNIYPIYCNIHIQPNSKKFNRHKCSYCDFLSTHFVDNQYVCINHISSESFDIKSIKCLFSNCTEIKSDFSESYCSKHLQSIYIKRQLNKRHFMKSICDDKEIDNYTYIKKCQTLNCYKYANYYDDLLDIYSCKEHNLSGKQLF